MIHIHDGNFRQYLQDCVIDGERKARGLVPRNLQQHPVGSYGGGQKFDMPVIQQVDWAGLIRELEASKSRLSDLRESGGPGGGRIPARDQNGKGFCWMHSGVGGMLLVRARDGQPYSDLSAYAGACIIKSYRDEGGWGAQGVDFLRERGIPTSEFWPQRSMSRSNDKPETWANAALHKFTDGWWDLDSAEYDRNLSFQQVVTCLLLRIPVVVDYNWWSHSIVAMDAVDGASQWGITRGDSGKLLSREQFDFIWGMGDPVTAGTGVLILNSWGDSWSQNGAGVLSGSKAVPDGSVAPRITTASAA
jgi:hypothetical protein